MRIEMMDEEYSTKNAGEAAFLYMNGAQLHAAIDSRGYEHFTFDNKDESARRLAEQFYEDAPAPARTLFAALGQLRHEASQARRAQRSVTDQGLVTYKKSGAGDR
jgi:hypothetical protein